MILPNPFQEWFSKSCEFVEKVFERGMWLIWTFDDKIEFPGGYKRSFPMGHFLSNIG